MHNLNFQVAIIASRFHQLAMEDSCFSVEHYAGVLGVTERFLRRACRESLGTPTSRYLYHRRKAAVHRDLLKSTANETETEIALRFEFWELGCFAVQYKARYGESPSATRRRCVTAIAA
jgi:AraC-like DNA-binding protein